MPDVFISDAADEDVLLELVATETAGSGESTPPPTTGQIWPRGNWS